jgi:hypothetical protein
MNKKIAPGIYPDMSSQDYHGHRQSYSKSSLVDYGVYPYNLIFQRMNPVRKDMFDIGNAGHTAILEPERWDQEIAVIPNGMLSKTGAKTTNAAKEFIAEKSAEGKAVITEKDRDNVLRMRDSVHEDTAHSEAKELLTGGAPEVSFFWEEHFQGEEIEEDTGYPRMISDQYADVTDETHVITMKCRPDYIPEPLVTVDLKTYGNPKSPQRLGDLDKLTRHCHNLKYHWSSGLTLRGLTLATEKQHRVYKFVFVEATPPYEVMVLNSSEEFIALGKKESMLAMQRLAYCDKHNHWPGIPNRTHQLGLPGYVFKKLNDGRF